MFYSTRYTSPVGRIVLTGTEESLAGLFVDGQKFFESSVPEGFVEQDNLPVFISVRKWLDDYFDRKRPSISSLSLAPAGGEFRQTVWLLLKDIPYGEVVTYGELAREVAGRLGKDIMSAQAVGGAVGHNPISIIIPCHRVIGANGNLTGYAGGIATKMKLLRHEDVDMTKMFVPQKKTSL